MLHLSPGFIFIESHQSCPTIYLLLIPVLICAAKATYTAYKPRTYDKESFLGDLTGMSIFFFGLLAAILLIAALFSYFSITKRLGNDPW